MTIRAQLNAARRMARLLFPLEGELHAHWLDLRNRLDGYCCAKDYTGYGHWRCALKLGHRGGYHRYVNYTWRRGDHAQYNPRLELARDVPRQTFSMTYLQRLRVMPWRDCWAKASAAARAGV